MKSTLLSSQFEFKKKHDEAIDVALSAPQGLTTMRTNSLFPKLGIKKGARSLWYQHSLYPGGQHSLAF